MLEFDLHLPVLSGEIQTSNAHIADLNHIMREECADTSREWINGQIPDTGLVDIPVPLKKPPHYRLYPVYQHHAMLIETLKAKRPYLISGHAASGKSTQIPMYLLEDMGVNKEKGKILMIRPENFGTLAMANQISKQLDESLGKKVGYVSNYQTTMSEETCLIICTYEIFLNTIIDRKEISGHITHIIIDDVDKRSKYQNLLMTTIKKFISIFVNVKIIMLSDSNNNNEILFYMNGVKEIKLSMIRQRTNIVYIDQIANRIQHPTKMEEHDMLSMIAKLILRINLENKFATILVFLKDFEEIEVIRKKLCYYNRFNLIVILEEVNFSDRIKPFVKKRNLQNIILTNAWYFHHKDAKYIIDSGKKKIVNLDLVTGQYFVYDDWISQRYADMRVCGGANNPVVAYRFYTFRNYSMLTSIIDGSHEPRYLESCILRIKMIKLCHFYINRTLRNVMIPIDDLHVDKAIKRLTEIEAIDQEGIITPMGRHLIKLSVDPFLGKMLLYGCVLCCVDPVTTIVAAIELGLIVNLPTTNSFIDTFIEHCNGVNSTHLLFLKIFQEWEMKIAMHEEVTAYKPKYGFTHEQLQLVLTKRVQLIWELGNIGFVQQIKIFNLGALNTNSNSWAMIKLCLVAGHFPNIAKYNFKTNFLFDFNTRRDYQLCTTSLARSMMSSNVTCVFTFNELIPEGRDFNFICYTAVSPLTSFLIAPSWKDIDGDTMYITNDTYLIFLSMTLEKIIKLRMLNPKKATVDSHKRTLTAIRHILETEDISCKLGNPNTFSTRAPINFIKKFTHPQIHFAM